MTEQERMFLEIFTDKLEGTLKAIESRDRKYQESIYMIALRGAEAFRETISPQPPKPIPQGDEPCS